MRGTIHEVEVLANRFDKEKGWVDCDPYVYVSNTDDPHYNMHLETAEEVDALIAELQAAKHYAFGLGSEASTKKAWPTSAATLQHYARESQSQSFYVSSATPVRVNYVGLDNVGY